MVERLHLSERHRRALEALLREHLPGVEVWAYGSRVSGRSHDGSDLDLVLRGPGLEEIPAECLAAFEEAVQESTIPFLVEARDWARLPERFHREIEREYVVLSDHPKTTPAAWPVLALRDVGVKLIDCVHKTPVARDSGYPYIGIPQMKNYRLDFENSRKISREDYLEWTKKAKPQPHDVILSRRTNPGVTAVDGTGAEFALGQNLVLLRADGSRVIPAFLKWLARSPSWWQQIAKFINVGAVFDSLRCADIPNFELPIPPLDMQHRVATLLDEVDDKIELNRRMNETLEAMARAIFKDWFVDFGPTRAKAEDRAPYLPPKLWDLFPDALDDQGRPVGWITRPASDLFEFNPRESVKKGMSTPYLDMAALPTVGPVSNAPTKREYKSGSKFRDGDTLFARITPCLENGKAAYVFNLGEEVIGSGSTEFIVIRSRSPLPQPASYLFARDLGFRDYAERSMTGTSGRQRANAEVLSQYEVTAPTEGFLWEALGDLVGPIMDSVVANALEARTLAATRDLLLPKLMSGEIRVPDAERIAEAVT